MNRLQFFCLLFAVVLGGIANYSILTNSGVAYDFVIKNLEPIICIMVILFAIYFIYRGSERKPVTHFVDLLDDFPEIDGFNIRENDLAYSMSAARLYRAVDGKWIDISDKVKTTN